MRDIDIEINFTHAACDRSGGCAQPRKFFGQLAGSPMTGLDRHDGWRGGAGGSGQRQADGERNETQQEAGTTKHGEPFRQ